jgi:hypothetical protein
VTAYEQGWSNLANGVLLAAAEESFDLFITTDKNLGSQQNLSNRKLAILVLPTTSWPKLQSHLDEIEMAVEKTRPGEYRELGW